MEFLKEKQILALSKEDLVSHLKSVADMLLSEEDVDSVELDDCQDLAGEDIIYDGEVIGIAYVTPTGLQYNNMKGDVIGTISFNTALSLDIALLRELVSNYQGTIVNEIL